MVKEKVFPVYKPAGLSPYETIKRLKEKYSFLEERKMAYAGKLDPLAEGVLLLVMDEELKKMQNYLNLSKKYEATVIFGFSSDSYDIMGIPEKRSLAVDREEVKKVLKGFEGDFAFSLPPFSSYEINKKPLFRWALEGNLDKIDLPRRITRVHSLKILGENEITKRELKEEIVKRVSKVKGSFRQKKILRGWNEILNDDEKKENVFLLKFNIHCDSGCYVRSIAHEAGKALKTGGVLFHLKRTAVGEYESSRALFL